MHLLLQLTWPPSIHSVWHPELFASGIEDGSNFSKTGSHSDKEAYSLVRLFSDSLGRQYTLGHSWQKGNEAGSVLGKGQQDMVERQQIRFPLLGLQHKAIRFDIVTAAYLKCVE